MKVLWYSLSAAFFLIGCSEPEPRRPVQQRSGSFFKASVERSKRILAQEEGLIQKLIDQDTAHQYMTSKNGFWYYYESRKDSSGYLPKTNDELILRYNVQSLAGDTIYSTEELGTVLHAVDKSQLFPGLRNAVKLLQEGEKATFIFPSAQAYGYKGDLQKIGPNLPLKSSVTLITIKKDSSNINFNL
ncbi:MAG: gliding motility-associated peptidyl-prolyl isomerase GldI [Bacteroidota bacterium]